MNLKSFLTGLIVASLFFAGCKNDQTLPRDRRAEDPLMGNEKRITEIISKMTLEEKVNMLHGKHMFTSEPRQG